MIVHEVDHQFLTLSRVKFHSMVLWKAMNVLRSKIQQATGTIPNGMTSSLVVSSKNLIRRYHKRSKLLVIRNSEEENTQLSALRDSSIKGFPVWYGIPDPGLLHALWQKGLYSILIRTGWIFMCSSSLISISWSILSKPLENSVKQSLAPQFPCQLFRRLLVAGSPVHPP